MWKVTLKGIAAKKWRILLTSVAIVLGVAFMAGTLVLSDTITRTFNNLVVNVNEGLAAQVRGVAQFKDTFGNQQRNRIDANLVDKVAKVPGVHDAVASVQGFGIIVDKNDKPLNAKGQAPPLAFAWNDSEKLNPIRIVEGHAPSAPDEILIDKRSADITGYRIGDKVRVVTVSGAGTSEKYTLAGIGKFGTADSPAGASLVFFTLPVAEKLLAKPGQIDSVQVAADPGVSETTLVQRIRAALVGVPKVEVVKGSTVVHEGQDNFQRGFSFFSQFLLVFAIVALIVGSFVIYNTFSITVAQRLRENALLRAVGASRSQVTVSVFLEALTVGIVASVIGLLAGIGLASGLKALLAALGIDIPAGGTVVKPGTIIACLAVGIIVTLVASLIPAVKASRVPPVAAMREVAVERTRPSLARIIGGSVVVLFGAANLLSGLFSGGSGAGLKVAGGALIIFVGLTILGSLFARPAAWLIGSPLPAIKGTTGRLARENAMRNPKRTSSTAAALMIGVGLVGFVTIFAASAKASVNHVIDSEMKADYIVNTSGQGSTLPPSAAQQIANVPGVAISSGLRIGSMKFKDSTEQVEAVDPAVVDQLFDVGVIKGSMQDLGTDGLAVYKQTAKDNNWTIGSKVPVQFAKTGHAVLTVRAIYGQQALAGSHVISLENYEQNFADQSDSIIMIKAEPGKAEQVRAGIEQVLKQYPNGKLQDRSQFKAAQAAQVNQILNLIYALLLMAILIAVFGIGNTLALSILERTHEIGLLRAVGMTRAQVRSTVRWEAVIIALFGTFLGLLVGVFFGWVLVQALSDQGIDQLALPAGQLLVLVILGALVGTLAAWLPARRAAKLDILRAVEAQ
jgi:putative ABC transport system permease protein